MPALRRRRCCGAPLDEVGFTGGPIAQLDRAPVYGTGGWRFESSWVRHPEALAFVSEITPLGVLRLPQLQWNVACAAAKRIGLRASELMLGDVNGLSVRSIGGAGRVGVFVYFAMATGHARRRTGGRRTKLSRRVCKNGPLSRPLPDCAPPAVADPALRRRARRTALHVFINQLRWNVPVPTAASPMEGRREVREPTRKVRRQARHSGAKASADDGLIEICEPHGLAHRTSALLSGRRPSASSQGCTTSEPCGTRDPASGSRSTVTTST